MKKKSHTHQRLQDDLHNDNAEKLLKIYKKNIQSRSRIFFSSKLHYSSITIRKLSR